MVVKHAAGIIAQAAPLVLYAGIISCWPSSARAQPAGAGYMDTLVVGLREMARTPLRIGELAGSTTTPAWKAALASLVVPGSGQIWTGRKWGWGLVAAEAALVGGGLWARSRGRDQQRGYERFADLHWDRNRYLDYIASYEAITGSPWPYAHHNLPLAGVHNHDYYEMIGKYEQFAPGWNDWSAGYDVLYRGLSANRDSYLHQRLVANRYLKWALTAGGLVFLNHVVASAEALLWGLRGGERAEGRSPPAAVTPWKAAAHSLLLPGWGQRLQGNKGLADVLVLVEGLCWGGLAGFHCYGDWKLADSRHWAAQHAGVYLGGKDDAYFRALARYPDWTTYNAVQLSGVGDPSALYPAGAGYEWRWSSEAAWKRYRELRRDERLAKNYATLALGGIVAGRLVGAVAALASGRHAELAEAVPSGGGSGGGESRLWPRIVPWYRHHAGGACGLRLHWWW